MTDETENLVLELLRGLRAEAADFRADVNKRLDAIGTQLEGIRYVLVASVGSLVTDMRDHPTRIAALEGMPA